MKRFLPLKKFGTDFRFFSHQKICHCDETDFRTFLLHGSLLYEPPYDQTNKMTSVLNEDSDQPVQPPSVIRVFAVCMKKHWVLSYLL